MNAAIPDRDPDPERGPLGQLRVLDLTRMLSGPYATLLLGDLGAEIIKVERPGRGDDTRVIPPLRGGESHYYLSANRNKRSIVVDLKQPEGRRIVLELARSSDILVENFRPGVADRLGIGFNDIYETNPSLIYCSISGFGQTGPWRERVAFDIVVQALSGVISVTGTPQGGPVRLGLPMADLAGGIFGAIGILAALVERGRTGKGQHVDVGMLDSMVGLLGYLAGRYLMTGESPPQAGNAHHALVPYGIFGAANGHIVIAIFTESFWPKLCAALGRPDLAVDPRYDVNVKRLERRDEVDSLVSAALRKATVEQWCERFTAYDVPHAPVLSVGEALRQEQVQAREMVRQVEHATLGPIEVLGPVIQFRSAAASIGVSGLTKGSPRLIAPPVLGADTYEVLSDLLGYPAEEIHRLEASAVIDCNHSQD